MLFKVDENLPHDVLAALRDAGHDATSVVEQGMVGSIDTVVAAACQAESRAIVTSDKDFADIRAFPPNEYAGIIVLRTVLQGKAAIMRVFSSVVPLLATEKLAGCLWIVQENGVRIRES